jgi:hypothetical protein
MAEKESAEKAVRDMLWGAAQAFGAHLQVSTASVQSA